MVTVVVLVMVVVLVAVVIVVAVVVWCQCHTLCTMWELCDFLGLVVFNTAKGRDKFCAFFQNFAKFYSLSHEIGTENHAVYVHVVTMPSV